ncbi:MAG: phenylalanine--tRNA ligase subunit alpha [Deltaproteobacteria bacterium]|nr:MAG: phenylalanine--tRNA ligase subunit alpha [Deltaproteobacteria bacterium]
MSDVPADPIAAVRAAFLQAADQAPDPDPDRELQRIEELRVRFLGKKGEVQALMRQLGRLDKADRPAFGQAVNRLKGEVSQRIEQLRADAERRAADAALEAGWLDPTLPAAAAGAAVSGLPAMGHPHPITRILDEVIDHFRGLGFAVASGPEIEDAWHNFDALNIPADHPARDVWDTFYTTRGEIPRTHTSSVQIRTMERQRPPIRIIAPGRCFRNETVDATHLAAFNQCEGLLIDRDITLGHLKATLEGWVHRLFGPDVRTRFRPAFYPFVEPGLDLDAQCFYCHGGGRLDDGAMCPVCRGKGWLEIIPCGMVHPNVLRNCGIDPDEWSGFAFGMGFDRLVMARYGIDDLRRLYSGRLDLVRQF